jgi:hypothetical protein
VIDEKEFGGSSGVVSTQASPVPSPVPAGGPPSHRRQASGGSARGKLRREGSGAEDKEMR